jgi:exopolyphosphatase/guanosine-5'-triphosphate,3'-diphosphate pyrophosphatase
VIAVIDIGTNTTRLLVAEVSGGRLEEVVQRRHFIAPIPGKERMLAELVEAEAALARAEGADEVVVVGTAALRALPAVRTLERACERAGGGLEILSEGREAELAFLGATFGLEEAEEPVAVVDVGGGSTEIAVGLPGEAPDWWASRPIGSRKLTDRALLDDPPSAEQIGAARSSAARRLANVEPPPSGRTLAVGGGAASLRRLCGQTLDRDRIAAAISTLCAGRAAEIAEATGIAPQRARLLPAALVIIEALCDLVPEPLHLSGGGMREGLLLNRGLELSGSRGEP